MMFPVAERDWFFSNTCHVGSYRFTKIDSNLCRMLMRLRPDRIHEILGLHQKPVGSKQVCAQFKPL